MKIRTDFVTNSSSSSFSIIVSVQDKKGNVYSFEEDPLDYAWGLDYDGGNCSFSTDLRDFLVKTIIQRIKADKNKKYRLRDVESDGRNDRIENVKVGDSVTLVKVPGYKDMEGFDGWWEYVGVADYVIDVRNDEGSLGILPGSVVEQIKGFFVWDRILKVAELKATVSSVTPLSQRKGNAKKALISVSIDAEEKNPGQSLITDSVLDLARLLMNAVSDCCDYVPVPVNLWDEDFDEEEDAEPKQVKFQQEIEKRKDNFVDEVARNISSIEDIAKIVVERNYSAWGDGADPIPDNDSVLCEFAEKVSNTSGEEKEQLLKDMLAYIHTSSPDRVIDKFGNGYTDFRYLWEGDEKDLMALVERLNNQDGSGDLSEGREYDALDLTTGTIESFAEYKLE